MRVSRKLRKHQDYAINHGWRIAKISGTPEGEVIKHSHSKLAVLVSMTGFLCVFGSVISLILLKSRVGSPASSPILPIFAGGICLMLAGKVVDYQIKRRTWHLVTGKCLDSEIRLISFQNKKQWALRVLCEYQMHGGRTKCTPITSWMGLGGRSGGEKYLSKRIGRDGRCVLLINPDNKHEAHLLKLSDEVRSSMVAE